MYVLKLVRIIIYIYIDVYINSIHLYIYIWFILRWNMTHAFLCEVHPKRGNLLSSLGYFMFRSIRSTRIVKIISICIILEGMEHYAMDFNLLNRALLKYWLQCTECTRNIPLDYVQTTHYSQIKEDLVLFLFFYVLICGVLDEILDAGVIIERMRKRLQQPVLASTSCVHMVSFSLEALNLIY